MHSLAQPGRSSLKRAGSWLRAGPGGAPRLPRGSPQQKSPPLSRTKTSTPTVALYLRKDAKRAAARRARTIARTAGGTAALPLTFLLRPAGGWCSAASATPPPRSLHYHPQRTLLTQQDPTAPNRR